MMSPFGVSLEPSDVPCKTCTACCRGDILVLSDDIHSDYETVGFVHPLIGPALKLAQKPDGTCIYLNGGCTIYDKRPRVCRAFDCRKFYGLLMDAPEGERNLIIESGLIGKEVIEAGRSRLS